MCPMDIIDLNADYTATANTLQGRVVLITGAGDGIGQALAVACGKLGAAVILLGRTVSKLEHTYGLISKAGGAGTTIYPMDLLGATPDDHDEMAQRIGDECGRLDAVVHCAAAFTGLSPLEHIPPLDWLRIVQVNLNAPFLLIRSCLPLLRAAPAGVVVFSDDCIGHRPKAYWGAYAASKAGVRALMQVLAKETEPDQIKVFALDPGAVDTRLRQLAYPAGSLDPSHAPDTIIGAYLRLLIEPQSHWQGRCLRVCR